MGHDQRPPSLQLPVEAEVVEDTGREPLRLPVAVAGLGGRRTKPNGPKPTVKCSSRIRCHRLRKRLRQGAMSFF